MIADESIVSRFIGSDVPSSTDASPSPLLNPSALESIVLQNPSLESIEDAHRNMKPAGDMANWDPLPIPYVTSVSLRYADVRCIATREEEHARSIAVAGACSP